MTTIPYFRPYIGITDFMNFDQVSEMLRVFKKHKRANSPHMLHVGVMMSHKTLNGLETPFFKAFPAKDVIRTIFSLPDHDLYYCLHYADYANATQYSDLLWAIEYGGPYLNALQLDMTWPDPDMVRAASIASGKEIEIILQVGNKAIEESEGDPSKLVEKLKRYRGIVHRVLLDKSMGKGVGMDAQGLIPFTQAIRAEFPGMGISAAGGLGPNSMDLIIPLVHAVPDISVDAQGQLRPTKSNLDPIHWGMAEKYLIAALAMLHLTDSNATDNVP